MLRRKFLGALLVYAFVLPGFTFAQSKGADTSTSAPAAKVYTAPKEVIDKIKDEGMHKSQVMQHLSYLTDVIGGRLTNSPNMKRANEWTRDTMAKWGMQARLEPWGPFGRGWSLKSFSAQIVDPQAFPLIAYPKAWSPSTKGPVTAEVVYLDINSDEDFAKYKGQLRGKVVLISRPREVKADFEGMGTRRTRRRTRQNGGRPNGRPARLCRSRDRISSLRRRSRSAYAKCRSPKNSADLFLMRARRWLWTTAGSAAAERCSFPPQARSRPQPQ